MAGLGAELITRVATGHPLPIADAMGALAAAESLHERRDRVVEVFRALLRYAASVALATRAQYGPGPGKEPAQLEELLRGLRSRGLTDGQWVGMMRGLFGAWSDKPAAYPVPGLAELFCGRPKKHVAKAIDGLLEMRKAETVAHGATGSADAIRAVLERREPQLADLLARFEPVWQAARLVVPLAPSPEGERQRAFDLSGYTPPRGRWPRIELAAGTSLPAGEPVLVDAEGSPLVSLHPIALFRKPSPEATEELFFLDGAKKRAAVFVAFPSMAEHREVDVWGTIGPSLIGEGDDAPPPSTKGIARPYRGLQSFGAEHAALFFGRERQAEALANRIRRHPMVTVTGASGSGKSSLLFAGVLPLLDDLEIFVLRPGADPIGALARRLASPTHAHDDLLALLRERPETLGSALHPRPLLLLVDQAEELFTLCRDEASRELFAEALASLGLDPEGTTRVVISLREDFFARLATLPALRGLYARQVEVVATPDREELIRIVIAPADLFGVRFEDEALVEEMLASVRGEPAALAMLQFCADQLWDRRDRTWKRLTWDAYRAIRGVEGALAAHAEETLSAMTTAQQATARTIFLALVTEDKTRAVVAKPDLVEMASDAEEVLSRLLDARLLTTREAEEDGKAIVVVELVHEALLGHWERLERWLEEDEAFVRVRARVAQAASRWDADGRRPDMLLGDGKPLIEAGELLTTRRDVLKASEIDFVLASQARARRVVRLKRAAIAALALLSIVAAGFGVFALNARERAETEAERALESERVAVERSVSLLTEQGRRELLDGHPLRALVYLEEAYRRGGDGVALESLLASAARPADALVATLRRDGPALYWAGYRPDGARFAVADTEGKITVFDSRSHEILREVSVGERRATGIRYEADGFIVFDNDSLRLVSEDGETRREMRGHEKPIMAMAVEGDRIVTASLDGTARLWSRDGGLVATLEGHEKGIVTVDLSPTHAVTGSRDDTARIWSAEGELLHTLEGFSRGVDRVRLSPDGSRLLVSDGADVRMHRVEDGELLARLEGHTASLRTLSFLGEIALTAGYDNTGKLWDPSGKLLCIFGGHDDFARGGTFTPAAINDVVSMPDGQALVTRGSDATARVWDVGTGHRLTTLMAHVDRIGAIAVHPKTGEILTAGDDGAVHLWKSTRGALVGVLGQPPGGGRPSDAIVTAAIDEGRVVAARKTGAASVWRDRDEPLALPGKAVAVGPEGRLALAGDSQVFVLDEHGTVVRRLEAPAAKAVAFQPGGDAIATAGSDGARIWRGESSLVLAHDRPVLFVAFSPDGTTLVAQERGPGKVWDAATGKLRFALPEPEESAALFPRAVFSSNGDRLLRMASALKLEIWDVPGKKKLRTLDGQLGAFSPDAALVAVADSSPIIRLFGAADGALVATLDGHEEPIVALGFFPDGERLFSASRDGTIRIWQARSGKELAILAAHRGSIDEAWLAPKGNQILTLGDGVLKLWDARLETQSAEELGALVERVSPWELRDGALVERR